MTQSYNSSLYTSLVHVLSLSSNKNKQTLYFNIFIEASKVLDLVYVLVVTALLESFIVRIYAFFCNNIYYVKS